MNVLLLTNHLRTGGITRYVLNLSCGLKKRGHKVFVAASSDESRKILDDNGISFLKLSLKTKSILSPRIFSAFLGLKKIIEQEDINIIHAQTRVTQFLAFVLSKAVNKPYISTFHGFYRPHAVRKLVPCLGDLTIAVSRAVGRHVVDDFNLNAENLRVIYNAISPDGTNSANAEYSRFKGNPTLSIVARLSAEKGHGLLFSAFKRLIKQYPQARLLVVGSGKQEQELKDWVRRENLAEQIIFLGNVSNLPALFRITDISVLPSTQEGLGFSILEAQISNVPVVASRVGGIVEVIEDKQTGILFSPGETDSLYEGIKMLIEDEHLRLNIIANAQKQIKQKFTLDTMAVEVEEVYKQVVKERK